MVVEGNGPTGDLVRIGSVRKDIALTHVVLLTCPFADSNTSPSQHVPRRFNDDVDPKSDAHRMRHELD